MFYCPHCGEAVLEDDAAACPHCGSDDETGWKQDADYYQVEIPDGYVDQDTGVYREYYDEDEYARSQTQTRGNWNGSKNQRSSVSQSRDQKPYFLPPIFAFSILLIAGAIGFLITQGKGQKGWLSILIFAAAALGVIGCLINKITTKNK